MKSKKKSNPFKVLCKKIYKLIDKLIVTPISTLVYKIQNKLGKDSKIEKMLNRPNALIILSLIFALILFYFVDSKAITFASHDAKVLNNVPVEVEYNSSAYVIEGLPETVDITLMGKKTEIYLAEQLGDNKVIVDLSDYQASNKPVKVKLNYNNSVNNVDYKIDPTYVTVTIREKVSDNKTISYDLMNQDSLDSKLSVKSVIMSKSDVIVRGSQETIDSISSIKALIDLSNEEFTKAGIYTVDNLKIVAYNNEGKIVDNVEIVSTNVSAKVELDSFSKNVPVKVQITGELVTGKAISSITINGTDANSFTTTIYGDEASLENVESIPLSIDVDGQGNNGSKTSKFTFSKPAGVRSISDESVTVVLNFGEAKQKTVTLHNINSINVPNGLIANLVSNDEKIVKVQVIGVESVLKEIDENDPTGITAYVDLTGLSSGPYSIPIKVEGNDSRLQYVVTKNANIVLSKTSE